MRRRSLRLRLTIYFGLSAAVLAILFATGAYFGVRHILVVDRETTDLHQSYVNADLVLSAVQSHSTALNELIHSLDSATADTSYITVSGVWYTSHNDLNLLHVIPAALQSEATHDVVSRQVVITNGSPVLYIDVPLPAAHAVYYQVDNLHDLDQTLGTMALLFAGGAVIVTALGVLGGRRLIRRSMAPLEIAAQAAQRVTAGALETRLPENAKSAEVAALATSFNSMLERLAAQLERDARFAGDVSHELRSPLTTLATSVEVMRKARDGLPPDGRTAFDLLATDVGTFQVLVEDLLEIARYDAGATSMHFEVVRAGELVRQSVLSAERHHQLAPVTVDGIEPDVAFVSVDRRRFERVITNLLDNAARYGGGATAVRLTRDDGTITVDVDDAGPGVDAADAPHVFDRFYRGKSARARGASRGTGLGLALVADHIEHFGGHIEVTTSPQGGARFRFVLPTVNEEES